MKKKISFTAALLRVDTQNIYCCDTASFKLLINKMCIKICLLLSYSFYFYIFQYKLTSLEIFKQYIFYDYYQIMIWHKYNTGKISCQYATSDCLRRKHWFTGYWRRNIKLLQDSTCPHIDLLTLKKTTMLHIYQTWRYQIIICFNQCSIFYLIKYSKIPSMFKISLTTLLH